MKAIPGLLLAFLPALGAAQADRFREIDRDGDGSISSEEWYGQRGVAPVPFTVVDVNGDSAISRSEFREWSSARGGASTRGITPADRFRGMDKNKDGVVSAEEWRAGSFAETPLAAVDANKDGTISRREFTNWDQRRPVGAAPAPPPGASGPGVSEPIRSLERVPGPTPLPPPSASRQRPPTPPVTSTPSGGIPGSSPNMSSGSGNTTR